MKNKEKGFTLIELVVVLALLSTFIGVLYVSVSGLTDDISRQRNEVYPKNLASSIRDYYLENSYDIDIMDGAILNDGGDVDITNMSLSLDVEDSLLSIYDSLPYANLAVTDGYNQPMLILVSELLEHDYEGTLIPYRVFAVVSSFNQDIMGVGDFQTTMDVTTGNVQAFEEESVVVMNTLAEQIERFRKSKERVVDVSRAYSQYYWSRHNLGVRDTSVDYFADGAGNPSWDNKPGFKVAKSCNVGSPSSINGYNTPGVSTFDTNLVTYLGLGSDAALTPWDTPLYMMNCGTINNVYIGGSTTTLSPRNPDNVSGQPYNAIIGFTMSNGQSYIEVISSTF